MFLGWRGSLSVRDRRLGFWGLRCLLAGLVIGRYVLTRALKLGSPNVQAREIAPPEIKGQTRPRPDARIWPWCTKAP